MKNLTKLSLALTAASLMIGSAAQANDVQLVGEVHPVCEITGLPTEIDFGYNPVNGTSDHTEIGVQCNEKSGATIELESLNGGLLLEGEDDHVVSYWAGLEIPGEDFGILGGGSEVASEFIAGSKMLAMGQDGSFWVRVDQDAKFAGKYTDVLTVSITAE